jgi:hypothetical protein
MALTSERQSINLCSRPGKCVIDIPKLKSWSIAKLNDPPWVCDGLGGIRCPAGKNQRFLADGGETFLRLRPREMIAETVHSLPA